MNLVLMGQVLLEKSILIAKCTSRLRTARERCTRERRAFGKQRKEIVKKVKLVIRKKSVVNTEALENVQRAVSLLKTNANHHRHFNRSIEYWRTKHMIGNITLGSA